MISDILKPLFEAAVPDEHVRNGVNNILRAFYETQGRIIQLYDEAGLPNRERLILDLDDIRCKIERDLLSDAIYPLK